MGDFVLSPMGMQAAARRRGSPADNLFADYAPQGGDGPDPGTDDTGTDGGRTAPSASTDLKLEDIRQQYNNTHQQLPQYQALPDEQHHGVWNRLKGAGMGLMTGLAQIGAQGGEITPASFGQAIGAGIGGAVNPEVPHRRAWEMGTLKPAMDRMKTEQAAEETQNAGLDAELGRRYKVAQINHLNADEWKFDPTTGLQYNKQTGAYRVPVDNLGRRVQPIRERVAGMQTASREKTVGQQIQAASDRQKAGFTFKAGESEKQRGFTAGQNTQKQKAASDLAHYKENETNKRAAAAEAGRNKRADDAEAGRTARVKAKLNPMGNQPKATAATIADILSKTPPPPRLAERLKGLSPDQQAAQWNAYWGIF